MCIYTYAVLLYIQPHIIAHCTVVNHRKRRKEIRTTKNCMCLNHVDNNTVPLCVPAPSPSIIPVRLRLTFTILILLFLYLFVLKKLFKSEIEELDIS
jgi:hypothetical protein